MKSLTLVAALLSCSALFGCGRATSDEGKPESTAAPGAATVATAPQVSERKFGVAITEKTSTPLDDLLKEPVKWGDKTVRTEGKVTAVCQAMGCWMEIGDDSGQAHIKMAGHAFFIPKDASGRHAIVQGKILKGDKDHCAEEAEQATGHVAKIEMEATGVELVD